MQADVTIRNVTEGDLASVNEIVMAAFRTTESRMPDLRRLWELPPAAWLLAVVQGAPVGTVAAVDYGRFAYVGDMVVRPEMQRQGIGMMLMTRLLAQLDARGTPAVLLDASQEGAPMYRKLDFSEVDRALIFEQSEVATPAFMPTNVHRMRASDLAVISAWDAPRFGANRARVLAQMLAAFPERAFVVEGEERVPTGYLFAQLRRVGPWVAERPQDAEALLEAALALSFDGAPRVIVPGMNRAAGELLQRYGFRLLDANHRHMQRGAPGLVRQRDAIYGQTSFGLG